ncbi:MAG: manganese catalase family protein [Bryobacteraceae bacterium]
MLRPVEVQTPDPRFGQYLLEQFGGATGELTAALQYFVQSFHCDNVGIRDMLQDIAVEEFGHLEMVGRLIEFHTKGADRNKAYDSPLFAVRGRPTLSRQPRNRLERQLYQRGRRCSP